MIKNKQKFKKFLQQKNLLLQRKFSLKLNYKRSNQVHKKRKQIHQNLINFSIQQHYMT